MGMQVEDHAICVWANRVHLCFMTIAAAHLASGALSGELMALPWRFAGVGGPKSAAIEACVAVLRANAWWALTDLLVYAPFHDKSMLSLNAVHHLFRIYLLDTIGAFASDSLDVLLCHVLYIAQCCFLYVQHGKLYNGRSVWFRRPFKWAFAFSILTRLSAYVWVFPRHFAALLGPDANAWLPLVFTFFPFLLFDASYFLFHFCAPPLKL